MKLINKRISFSVRTEKERIYRYEGRKKPTDTQKKILVSDINMMVFIVTPSNLIFLSTCGGFLC